jgi:hypothetical protein
VTFSLGKINLKIRPIAELRPHEETVNSISERVCRSLVRDGVQRDPIVLDEKSGTILDGAHRVEALKKAGAQCVLAYLLDYKDPRVQLYRWYRLVRKPSSDCAREIIAELNLETLGPLESTGLSAAPNMMVLVMHQGDAFGRRTASVEENTGAMRRFDRAAAARGLRVEFVDEGSAADGLINENDLTLVPPRFSKEDVLEAGANGKLFPPKSTLHVFPFRPLGVRYPLEELRAGRDILETVLKSRRPRLVDPSSSHLGRDYREAIVVFD